MTQTKTIHIYYIDVIILMEVTAGVACTKYLCDIKTRVTELIGVGEVSQLTLPPGI